MNEGEITSTRVARTGGRHGGQDPFKCKHCRPFMAVRKFTRRSKQQDMTAWQFFRNNLSSKNAASRRSSWFYKRLHHVFRVGLHPWLEKGNNHERFLKAREIKCRISQ